MIYWYCVEAGWSSGRLSQSRSLGFLVCCGRTRHERAFARSRPALVRSCFALTVTLRAQKLDLWASLAEWLHTGTCIAGLLICRPWVKLPPWPFKLDLFLVKFRVQILGNSCKISKWFTSYQLGFLTLLSPSSVWDQFFPYNYPYTVKR